VKVLITPIEPQLLSGQKIWTSIASQETPKLWCPFWQAIRKKEGLSPTRLYSIGRYEKKQRKVTLRKTVNLKSVQRSPKRFLFALHFLRRSAWKADFMQFLGTMVQLPHFK